MLHGEAGLGDRRRGTHALPGLRLTTEAAPSGRLGQALAAAVTTAVLLVVAHPPIGVAIAAPLVVVAFLTAVRLLPTHPGRIGALAGLVAHLLLLHWIATPAGIVAWVLLSAVQAGWWALLGVAVGRWLDGPWSLLVVPVAWVGVDVARLTVPLGGFLWGDLASATIGWSWLHPVIRIGGGQAATLVVVTIGTAVWFVASRVLPILLGDDDGEHAIALADRRTRPGLIVLVGTSLVVTLVTIAPPPTDGTLDVLVVQANDVEDWFRSASDLDVAIAQRHLEATRDALAGEDQPDVVLWPESSIDRDPSRDRSIAAAVVEAATLTGGRLLAGVNLDGVAPNTFQNSLAQFTSDGAITDRYVKRNLVPFGEYVPFRNALDWFPPLRRVPRDGVAGEGPQSLTIGGAVLAPIICFETMEPGTVRSNILAGDEDAGLIVTATNDASFGRTGEPAQHLAQARLRAVETGRWVVYGAVSGSSAFVTPDGDVVQATELFTRDTIRREIPLAAGRTPFLTTGDLVGPIAAAGLIALILSGLRPRRREDLP